jgi:hypothetical protein
VGGLRTPSGGLVPGDKKMDASRVLGTLRAHCDRLELELRELDADIEEAKAMVSRQLGCRPVRCHRPRRE